MDVVVIQSSADDPDRFHPQALWFCFVLDASNTAMPWLHRKRVCLTEEHYIPSYLSHMGVENETDCRGWLLSAVWDPPTAAHPKSYAAGEISPELCANPPCLNPDSLSSCPTPSAL